LTKASAPDAHERIDEIAVHKIASVLQDRALSCFVLSCATLSISASLPDGSRRINRRKRKSSSPPPQKIDPRFQETQSLLQQGRFEKHAQQIQTELTRDPKASKATTSSASSAFPKRIFLCPRRIPTRADAGSIVHAHESQSWQPLHRQQKLDLAEKEFKEVLPPRLPNSEAN